MMKLKKFIIISLLLLISVPIFPRGASKNNLNFYEKGSNLYYRTSQFDSNLFLHKENMRPGNVISETLNINNGTSHEYGVYLQSVPAKRSENVEKFLENMSIVVKNDGKVIAEGNMLGKSVSTSRKNSLDKIYLGEYGVGETSSLEVTARLNPDYVPPEEEMDTYVDWKFYAGFGDDLVEIRGDDGEDDFSDERSYWVENLLYFALVILLGLSAAVLGFMKKKNNKENKKS